MIKIFTLLFDLLEVPFNDNSILTAEALIKNPDLRLISYFDKWFIFFAFQDFLLGKISQEDFISIGDSFWSLYINQNNPVFAKEALAYWLKSDPNKFKNSLILFPKEEKLYLEKLFPSLDSILKKIKSQIFYV